MIANEIRQMYDILVSILGESKSPLDDTLQLQFSCPRCQERDGVGESRKFHLEVNIAKGIYNCWKCASIDGEMKGSIYKLIKLYGTPDLLGAYKQAIRAFRETSLYKLTYSLSDFQNDHEDGYSEMSFPTGYTLFKKELHSTTKAFLYLQERGLDWGIIEDYQMGFTTYDKNNRNISNRIILPSFDKYGQLNYWTGRDYSGNKKRQRYFNPDVKRKDIIFNEEKIEWNADITLVEGPFDHIVVPNSIPLLGKGLTPDYYLYQCLYQKTHANINILLDNDAKDTALSVYKLLNEGKLKGKIRFIELPSDDRDLDPSKIFQLYGRKGMVQFLNTARKL